MPVTEAIADFGNAVRTWRRMNNVSQAALASTLGVSQPAIARWEQGIDMPAPARLKQLRDMMAKSGRDDTMLQSLFIERQSAVRALFDFDQTRMLANSVGFRQLWPDSSLLLDMPMRDRLVDEADHMTNNPEIRREILAGAIGLISGVSQRQTDLQTDAPVLHRWHICFRRYGALIIADMAYEPCAGDTTPGIAEMVHMESLGTAASG